MINIETLTELYFSSGEPTPYKLKCGYELKIFPVKVKNWSEFSSCLDCVTFDKNEINDINIIKMSNLDFLFYMHINNDPNINLYKLATIIKYSFGEKIISMEKSKGKNVLAILDSDKPKNVNDESKYKIKYYITAKEFDEIMEIILFQNIYDYDNRHISSYVKELYQSYIETVNTNQVDPTLERKKVFVMSKVGMSLNEINELQYRIFNQMYVTNVEIDLYYSRTIMQASEKYDIKEEIVYPLFEKKKDRYDCLFVQKSSVTNKLNKIQ